MIFGWLARIVVVIALVGALTIEVGSPLVTRAQLDDVAHEVADDAGLELLDSANPEKARAIAELTAAHNDADLIAFTLTDDGRAVVTVEREARSLLLKRWSRTRSWYEVRVTATSTKGRR